MAYEKFEPRKVRKVGSTITIRSEGRLRFNAEATSCLRTQEVERLSLFWDKHARKIGLQPASHDDKASYKLSFSKEQNSADLAAKSFLKHIGWPTDESVDAPLEWNQKLKIFEAKIPKTNKEVGLPLTLVK